MSKFNSYIRQVDRIAAEAFEQYTAAENALKNAESKRNAHPLRIGLGAEYEAKSARYEADYKEAQLAFVGFKRTGFEKYRKRMDEVRKEFISAVGDAFAADPAQLDMATLELLKSGILSAAEYSRLMDKAISDDNHTMARMIGQHAKAAAENAKSKNEATEFRMVAHKNTRLNGSDYVEAFDFVTDLFDRCTRTPTLYGKWDELAGNVIENF